MRLVMLTPLLAIALSGCIVTLPAKAVYNTAKYTGKAVWWTGKGVYQVGKMTVNVADGALDGTERVLRLTILTSDATGSVVRTTREINAAVLDAELAAIERSGKVTEVFIETVE
ncbi:hypothetical protein RYZ27_09970 [Hyphomonas sp. FCG-A18]|jgi:hypothetical protein|uniref:hypothetical protein n=1 Tax=Hyphomonas sp. FCG-A18 TaxID=3080019 RepID=UPI002B2BB3DE|nr:hypothetical protein RYZ27_09970 [Hyphomonas sp. FCG-A18]